MFTIPLKPLIFICQTDATNRYLLTTIYKVQIHYSNHFSESKKMFDINLPSPSLIFPEKISFYRNFRADSLLIRFARVIDTNQLLNGLIAG